MRKIVVALTSAGCLALTVAGSGLAHPPGNHLHCVTTPNGNVHSIARGVTMHEQVHETAFHNFHEKVHLGPGAPKITGADFNAPYSC